MPDVYEFKLPFQADDELLLFTKLAFGVSFPPKAACPQHVAPARAYCDAYFARTPMAIWKGSRGFAGKTHMLSTLASVEAATLGCDVVLLGGSGEQSKRALETGTKIWNHPNAPRHLLAAGGDLGLTIIRFAFGNSITALTASQKSVRGGHAPRLRMDEIDEMDIRILDAALGQTMQHPRAAPQTVLSSTHQYADGTMTEMLKRAAQRGWPVMEWSVGQGTNVLTCEGYKPIEAMGLEDEVLTRGGWRSVQHVSCMGYKPVLNVELSNGRALRLTPEHRVAVQDGWLRAEQLSLGTFLVPAPYVDLHAGAAMPTAIARGDVGVFRSVLMPVGAMRSCDLCHDPRDAKRVDGVAHVFEMGGVDAGAVTAEVVDFESDRFAGEDAPRETMCAGFTPAIRLTSDHPVPIVAGATLPDPAPLVVGLHPSPQVVGVGDDAKTLRDVAIAARDAANPVAARATMAVDALWVVGISHGVMMPVWDIGVEGDHEFVAEGIVVHNCYKDTLDVNGGWLDSREVARKQNEVTQAMWSAEYDLQEPSAEGRAIDGDALRAMFDPELGSFAGGEGEYVEIEKPDPHGRYAHGADWARVQHFTVITTLRVDTAPMRLVAFERMRRLPWPLMTGKLDQRIERFGGKTRHDGTGLGDVVDGFLEADRKNCEPVILVGRARLDLFSKYIAAIERHEIIAPMIEFAEREHRYATNDDVYGNDHPPDSFVAGALAYEAATVIPEAKPRAGFGWRRQA